MTESILNIINNLRIQDLFDVLIIWVMTSVVLIWFKERASRFVFVGIGLLGVVYLAARFFQLYLTTVVLQGFFAILLFVLVVIFQEDLRRFFEQLAMWGRLRQKLFERQPVHQAAETIAQAVSNMVRKHIGALIVIKGQDPLDRHLNGGVPLNGVLSQSLLESIFDPHSVGHDGAVVIEGSQMAQFGCHLPLSRNAGGFGPLGLRHTAALGLSERSDALCIVVSEERGTISIARGEQIRVLANAAALRAELEAFYAQQAPRQESRPVVRWLKVNPREKIIALLLSCILWIAFGYQKESIRRDFTVPLEYLNVSPDWVIEKPKITDVKIMLMGPPQAFGLLNPDTLKLSVDLSQIREGRNEITLSKEMVKRPSNLMVAGITPPQLAMTASRLIEASLPVQVVTQGRPPEGRSVQKISVSPSDVTVLIPGKSSQNGVRIRTEPIDLEKLTASATVEARLIFPSHIQFAGGKPPVVKVTIILKKTNQQPAISPSS
jgi:uncharacterized protein (TIGR00159 family)